MNEYKTEKIKELIAQKIKDFKGETPYNQIAGKSNTTPAKISDVANNRIDCRLKTLIEIATGLRIHPKDLFDIPFDFDKYYADLDGAAKDKKSKK